VSAAKSLARFALTLGGTTGLALSVPPAQAAYIAYASEQGGDVIIRGAGSIGVRWISPSSSAAAALMS
jgi:hypothetical protein